MIIMGFYQFTFWPLESVNVCVGKVGEPKGFLDLIMFAVLLSQKSKKRKVNWPQLVSKKLYLKLFGLIALYFFCNQKGSNGL